MDSERRVRRLPRDQRAYRDRAATSRRFGHPVDLPRLRSLLPARPRVLDFGCGYGRLSARLAAHGLDRVVGVDTSRAMVERGRREHPELDLRVLADGRLPWEEESFDAVLMISVLTCIPAPQEQARTVAELRRVLATGGILYVSDLLLQEDERNRERYAAGEGRYGVRGVFELSEGVVLTHLDPERLAALFAGFEQVERLALDVETMNGNAARAVQWIGRKEP